MIPSQYNRGVLFVSQRTLGYAELAARHEASEKNWSYYGKSDDQLRSGIWVPVDWWEDLKAAPKTQLVLDDRPPAKEIDPFDDGGKSHSLTNDDEVIFGV